MTAPWNINPVFATLDWEKARATQNLGITLPGLMVALNSRVCIEIGVWDAFTTQLLCAAMSVYADDGLLLTCELDPAAAERSRAMATRYPSVHHHVIEGDSRGTDWRLQLAIYGKTEADLALVDGGHEGDVPTMDCLGCAEVLAPNGLMIVHDYAPGQPDVIKGVEAAKTKYGLGELFLPEWRYGGHHFASAILQKPKAGVWQVKPYQP